MPEPQENKTHEPNALSIRGVMIAATALVLLVVVASLLMGGLDETFQVFSRRPAPLTPPSAGGAKLSRGAPLNPDQPSELRALRASESKTLHSYGWVDRDGGVARIPVERAIAILAERGLPTPKAGGSREKEPPAAKKEQP